MSRKRHLQLLSIKTPLLAASLAALLVLAGCGSKPCADDACENDAATDASDGNAFGDSALDGSALDGSALDGSASGPERCNLLDDDGDGRTDESCVCDPNETRPCGTDVGRCQAGVLRCTGDGRSPVCMGEIVPAPENCNGEDDDCDGRTDESFASERCGTDVGLCAYGMTACMGGAIVCAGEVGPALELACDLQDEDCDGHVDENLMTAFYPDRDQDGFGDESAVATQACELPFGFTIEHSDCDDNCPSCHSGGMEVCDGHDNDCDGNVDEGVLLTFYQDGDHDHHGTPSVSIQACTPPSGYVASNDDCDDSDIHVFRGQTLYFDHPRPNGSWDYDCNNIIDYEVLRHGNMCDCVTDPLRWANGYRPACGETSLAHACHNSSGMCIYDGTLTRMQRCI